MPGTAAKAVPPWGSALGFQKSSTCSLCCPGDPVLEEPGRPLTQPVTLSRAVCDRLSLVHHITSPKAVSAPWRRLQLLPSCFPWSFSLHPCLNLRCRSCLLSLAAAPGTVWWPQPCSSCLGVQCGAAQRQEMCQVPRNLQTSILPVSVEQQISVVSNYR